eukprot:TRINITY_DN4950_c0_g1_i3.p2 TRINITY_DN4950_c0_g1~~TRINITY_DN4950_c0_g1_i3.p2  ORF type:complete len:198 (+),score=8.33 TRINITY_DN4950_c0_g1_i3:875-1468(+)
MQLATGSVEAEWRHTSGPSPSNGSLAPNQLALSPDHQILYVSDTSAHCVKGLRVTDGQCVQVLGNGQGNRDNQMNTPQGVVCDHECVYVADSYNHRVVVYSQQTGRFLRQFGRGQGSGDFQFNNPIGVAVDSEKGVLYVVDQGNHRLSVWRISDGSFIRLRRIADDIQAKPVGVGWDATARTLYMTLHDSQTAAHCR